MIKPTIHTGGTGARQLLDGYKITMTALRQAETILAENGPNARDYYPQGETAYSQARDEHGSRVERLKAIRAEIEELAKSVLDEHYKKA